MESLVRERRPLRKLFGKYEDDVVKLLGVEEPDLAKIKVTFGMASQTFEKLAVVDQKFIEYLQSNVVTPEAEDEEYEGQGEFKMRLELLRESVDKVITPAAPLSVITDPTTETAASFSGDGRFRNFTLPQVKLPVFSGQLKDWLSYWAKFEPIHEDKFMSGSDKFNYLLQTLESGSEPHKIVSRFPQKSENYELAVEALQKKYANPDILLEVYIRELLGLIVTTVTAKEKLPLKELFLSLDSQIRAMRTLNLEQADPSIWLFPLVEACLPGNVLKQWKRRGIGNGEGDGERRKNRIDSLLEFMENEVALDDDVNRTEQFSVKTCGNRQQHGVKRSYVGGVKNNIPTMATFHVGDNRKYLCVFCGIPSHESWNCLKAKKMSMDEKKEILRKDFRCYRCLGKHHSRSCQNTSVRCQLCNGFHCSIMCESRQKIWRNGPAQKRAKIETPEINKIVSSSNQVCSSTVVLQTVMAKLESGGKTKNVRIFLDNGSQRTYIMKSTAAELSLEPISIERVIHSLFGGVTSQAKNHDVYEVEIASLSGNFSTKIKVRDERLICGRIPRALESCPEVEVELEKHCVRLSDQSDETTPVELLIGADFYGKILTGKIINLDCGLTAIETKFGWTVMGEVETAPDSSSVYHDMMVCDATIAQLWELDRIGVENPEVKRKGQEQEEFVKKRFVKKMKRNSEGRYVIRLPWKDGHPSLPSNKDVALKRLQSTVANLKRNGLLTEYGKLFKDWEEEGFIEPVKDFSSSGHYVPHRPVIKRESETTPVRPVFDASCKTSRKVSLNDCLEKGPNLIQLIPAVLNRFRLKKVAFVADIRKAFQMVEIDEADRDSMRFLWCRNGDPSQLIEYRHSRVMFGATSSPFILGAVLEHYLKSLPEEKRKLGEDLWRSFYVDNCVASVDCQAEYLDFRQNATELLSEIKMDLRLWYSNVDVDLKSNQILPVLGLLWDRDSDMLSLKLDKFSIPAKVTKKTILSSIAKIFDPIGFSAPALIPMKMLLQRAWIEKLSWDEELPEAEEKLFLKWTEEMECLKEIKIPRLATAGERETDRWSLHTFADASATAYAAVTFLRVATETEVQLNLISAKARVAPLQNLTIPRLELLSCLLGARISDAVKKSLSLEKIKETFWSDSTTALAWIQRKEPWATWVGNRVKEIQELTGVEDWRHVPGVHNPADLPSRGCSPKQLLNSNWWLGPDWLKLEESEWPKCITRTDEDTVFSERRKSEMPTALVNMTNFELTERFRREYDFDTQIRILGWIGRFHFNSRVGKIERRSGNLSENEIKEAKVRMWRLIQNQYFRDEECESIKKLEVIEDESGILRVKTRLTLRDDLHDFKYPVLLHGKSEVVRRMIFDLHRANHHAGIGFLMSKLRENFWILQARKTIRSVTTSCLRCRRFSAKAFVTPSAPLPLDRIKDAEVFQTTGVDLAGPLHLKNGKKVWLVIFTCAVYRAVHFIVVGSMSTVAFIGAMKKFVEKFRRPDTVYCDNGTNFRGAANLFRKLDWKAIEKEYEVNRINFRHSPPISAWYGGWWERLIGTAKNLLKRSVGKGTLSKSELEIVIREIGDIMNQRPLTYVSEDPRDLEPLTPAHFLYPLGNISFPEGDMTSAEKLRIRWSYMKKLKDELRGRFRREYLAYLVSRNARRETRGIQVGELVLVGNDNQKRLQWPIARVREVFEGKDNVGRVARIKTAEGELIRTVQRLFPLELDLEGGERKVELEKVLRTRFGRKVRAPMRFGAGQ